MAECVPLLENPKRLLLDLALERSQSNLLQLIVGRIADSECVGLARIWLRRPGEGCPTCPMQQLCPDRTECLHLVASAGRSKKDSARDYARIDGQFRRFPLGVRKVGQIGATGDPIEAPDLNNLPDWIADPNWIREEGIRGFGGQPLVHAGQVLGVLAVFSRSTIDAESFDWLRMLANHAAVAIANARAWDDVHALRRQLEKENEYLQEEVLHGESFGGMIGQSAALQAIVRQIDLVAPTDTSVLIQGESGVGKELVAREIHQRSRRAERPLIKVNCAAVPHDLFESEFFGHARGAFTGALRDRAGRFELAQGGTLFLDEIGEIPLELQSKLLRILQEGELERVGEERTRKIDVRIIAATNRDLEAEVDSNRFRADLYYRLSVFPIDVAPLRRRNEDIPILASHFLSRIARRLGRPVPALTLVQAQQLQRYDWPGNVRELQHVLERALITSPRGRLRLPALKPKSEVSTNDLTSSVNADERLMTANDLRLLEIENLRRALRMSEGRIYGAGGAAALLGMKPTTLSSRIRALGLRPSKSFDP